MFLGNFCVFVVAARRHFVRNQQLKRTPQSPIKILKINYMANIDWPKLHLRREMHEIIAHPSFSAALAAAPRTTVSSRPGVKLSSAFHPRPVSTSTVSSPTILVQSRMLNVAGPKA